MGTPSERDGSTIRDRNTIIGKQRDWEKNYKAHIYKQLMDFYYSPDIIFYYKRHI